jgi:hypothetical protein
MAGSAMKAGAAPPLGLLLEDAMLRVCCIWVEDEMSCSNALAAAVVADAIVVGGGFVLA